MMFFLSLSPLCDNYEGNKNSTLCVKIFFKDGCESPMEMHCYGYVGLEYFIFLYLMRNAAFEI